MSKQGQDHLSKRGDKRIFWQEKLRLFSESGTGTTALCTQHQVLLRLEKKIQPLRPSINIDPGSR
jgi:hypothetical protein